MNKRGSARKEERAMAIDSRQQLYHFIHPLRCLCVHGLLTRFCKAEITRLRVRLDTGKKVTRPRGKACAKNDYGYRCGRCYLVSSN